MKHISTQNCATQNGYASNFPKIVVWLKSIFSVLLKRTIMCSKAEDYALLKWTYLYTREQSEPYENHKFLKWNYNEIYLIFKNKYVLNASLPRALNGFDHNQQTCTWTTFVCVCKSSNALTLFSAVTLSILFSWTCTHFNK